MGSNPNGNLHPLPSYSRQGYEPLLAVTFCDREASAGTWYRAAGWTALGMTKGPRVPARRRTTTCPTGGPRRSGSGPCGRTRAGRCARRSCRRSAALLFFNSRT